MDFARVVRLVADFLDKGRFPYAAAGAVALQAYGLARATQDLDFITDADARASLVPFLESQGYETLHSSDGYSNHLHAEPSLGRVDFVYVGGSTSRRLFETCQRSLSIGGRRLPVPRAEHLAAMKAQAIKNDPRRTLQDLADVQFLLRLPGIDRDEIRGYFERAGLGEKFDEAERLG